MTMQRLSNKNEESFGMRWIKSPMEEEEQEQYNEPNEGALIKQKAVNDLVEILKERQEETKTAQERVHRLIKDIANLEYANKIIEKYKSKCEFLQESLEKSIEEYKKYKEEMKEAWDTEAQRYNEKLKQNDVMITKLDKKTNELKNEIQHLKRLNEALTDDNLLNVTYKLFVDDPYIDTQEIFSLREFKRNYSTIIRQIEKKVKEREFKIKELEIDKLDMERRHKDNIEEKDIIIKDLNMSVKLLEEKIFQKTKGVNWKEKLDEAIILATERAKEIEELKENKETLQREVGLLTARIKKLEEQILLKEDTIKALNEEIAKQQNDLKLKTEEYGKLKADHNDLINEAKKNRLLLNAMQLKYHDLNFTVVGNLKKDIKEKNKVISTLKGVVKDKHTEIEIKDNDIVQLKKNLRLQKHKSHIDPYSPNRLHSKIVKRSPIIKEIKDKPIKNTNTEIKEVSNESHSAEEKAEDPLPLIKDYKEKCNNHKDNYYYDVKTKNYRNNSINVRNVLNYDLNNISQEKPTYNKIHTRNFKETMLKGLSKEYNVDNVINKTIDKQNSERTVKYSTRVEQLIRNEESSLPNIKA